MAVGAGGAVATEAAVVTGTGGSAVGARVGEAGAGVSVEATVLGASMVPSPPQAARVTKPSNGMIKAANGPFNPILVIISWYDASFASKAYQLQSNTDVNPAIPYGSHQGVPALLGSILEILAPSAGSRR